MLAYIAYTTDPISRRDRVAICKARIFAQYGNSKQQEFLDFVLDQYIHAGVSELDQSKLLHLLELRYRSLQDAVHELGSVTMISEVFTGFQQYLYAQDEAA